VPGAVAANWQTAFAAVRPLTQAVTLNWSSARVVTSIAYPRGDAGAAVAIPSSRPRVGDMMTPSSIL
jgi:hypothetical protein